MANILIVDDSRTSRKMLRSMLEEAGHVVVAEGVNGEDGYQKFKEVNPDLVTLDITMPVLDGLESLQMIKQYNGEAKVIMITAAGQKEKMIQAIKCGAAEFIVKPYDNEGVKLTIQKVLAF